MRHVPCNFDALICTGDKQIINYVFSLSWASRKDLLLIWLDGSGSTLQVLSLVFDGTEFQAEIKKKSPSPAREARVRRIFFRP